MNRTLPSLLFLGLLLFTTAAQAQTVSDISPSRSTLDTVNANGASGGRVNGLAVDPNNNQVLYGASEYGGLWQSTTGGDTWVHLDGHAPTATWDVEVDPSNSQRVIATSLYDGRVFSQSGINVSFDGGNSWFHPPTALPPPAFCTAPARQTEPSAYGISFDPDNPQVVYVGTSCGLALSRDSGLNWVYIDPTPGDAGADDIFDVIVHDGGIIDLCGNDGHRRSVDSGNTWTSAAPGGPAPGGGRCSIDVSPDEPYVLFIVSGVTIMESDDGGNSWPTTFAAPARQQGRIPFVAVNDRAGVNFDLWFSDTVLFRAACATPSPAAPGGAARCPASVGWSNAQAGAHFDAGAIVFDTSVSVDACPLAYSNDGGIYIETQGASPACHTPAWEQPTVTPHALWYWDLDGADQAGLNEDLYSGDQDTGTFGSNTAGLSLPNWVNANCCDSFDVAAEAARVVTTVCCDLGGARPTFVVVRNPGGTGGSTFAAADYPPGNLIGFSTLDTIANFAPGAYVMVTRAGVFVTQNITATPVAWVQLGVATTPPGACAVQAATQGGTTTFVVKAGGCNGDRGGSLWRYTGTTAAGNWQRIVRNGNSSFGVYAVDETNPNRILASDLAVAGAPQMVITNNAGATWQTLPVLDNLMTGGGLFRYQNQRGVRGFGSQTGYPQPSLVAFDPEDTNILAAGAVDAGVFLSIDGGTNWQLITDPFYPGISGTPHIPRPHHAYFDHEPSGQVNLYVGTTGRGAWRISFEEPGPGAVVIIPAGWEFDFTNKDHHIDRHGLLIRNESLNSSVAPPVDSWTTHVEYDDKNDDDDYVWDVRHQVISLRNAASVFSEEGWLPKTSNGTSTHAGSVTSSDLAGFSNAFVVLKGWLFDFTKKDHHINEMGVRLTNVSYNAATGTVNWTAEAQYADKNRDDNYRWRYQWQVIAFNNAALRVSTRNGSDDGGTDTDAGSVTDPVLRGFERAVVLPIGWKFDFTNKDHHINETGFAIRNVSYNSSAGTVSWSARLNYADKNFDDDYNWQYDVAILTFNGGGSVISDDGPFSDGGGSDEESFTHVVP